MVFHLNLTAGQSVLKNLETIPFPSEATKTCIQLYKPFPDPKAKYGVRYSYYQSGWRGLENNAHGETVARSEKATDPISLSLWKIRRGLLFSNHISLKNTLKTKQNWQCRIYCLLLFCLQWPLFAPLPWKREGYLSLQPFYNNVPFLTKQQRKYQVKPFPPPLMIGSIQPQRFRRLGHVHTWPLMRNIQVVIYISVVPACAWFFLDLFASFRGKGWREFPMYAPVQVETLDGDRENSPSRCRRAVHSLWNSYKMKWYCFHLHFPLQIHLTLVK